MAELGVNVSDDAVVQWLKREEGLQRTGLLVAYGGELVACISVEDPIKAEAGGVVARLREQRVRCRC